MFSQAPLGRQSRPKWFMRLSNACQLFVLDKCYTKQKLTNLMTANNKKMKVCVSKKKNKKKPSFQTQSSYMEAAKTSAQVKVSVLKNGSMSRELTGVEFQGGWIHAYLLQQDPCIPTPTPGWLPAHQIWTPGSPHQTSPLPAQPANTLYPSAQPAALLGSARKNLHGQLSDASQYYTVIYCIETVQNYSTAVASRFNDYVHTTRRS